MKRLVDLVFDLYGRFKQLLAEALKFGTVGGVVTVVDIGAFNLFRIGLGIEALTSTIMSMVIATTLSFAGNREWTFQHRERGNMARQYALFFFFNGVGIAITLAVVGISHYLLGFTSPLADNIAKNVVGLAVASLFRFYVYRTWVFPHRRRATAASRS